MAEYLLVFRDDYAGLLPAIDTSAGTGVVPGGAPAPAEPVNAQISEPQFEPQFE